MFLRPTAFRQTFRLLPITDVFKQIRPNSVRQPSVKPSDSFRLLMFLKNIGVQPRQLQEEEFKENVRNLTILIRQDNFSRTARLPITPYVSRSIGQIFQYISY